VEEHSLLVCGAHPDDETFFAGTMAKYVSEGVRVAILCGTRGERGSTGDLCSIEELPARREAELREAMRVVGLHAGDVHFLPYEDQKLAQAPLDEARREIVRIIRLIRPQVVIGFDLQGVNGHSDHVAISRLTSDAIAAAADARWYPENGDAFSVSRLVWAPVFRPWTLPNGLQLADEPGVDFLIDTQKWAGVKAEAVRAHRTQFPGLGHLFFEHGSPEETLNREAFRLAWGLRPSKVPCGDLFEGL
jgi:LmbE family N-acetylglucosaminyl deacetylase